MNEDIAGIAMIQAGCDTFLTTRIAAAWTVELLEGVKVYASRITKHVSSYRIIAHSRIIAPLSVHNVSVRKPTRNKVSCILYLFHWKDRIVR